MLSRHKALYHPAPEYPPVEISPHQKGSPHNTNPRMSNDENHIATNPPAIFRCRPLRPKYGSLYDEGEAFPYLYCGRCGTLQLNERIKDIGKYYREDYYSFHLGLKRQNAIPILSSIPHLKYFYVPLYVSYFAAILQG